MITESLTWHDVADRLPLLISPVAHDYWSALFFSTGSELRIQYRLHRYNKVARKLVQRRHRFLSKCPDVMMRITSLAPLFLGFHGERFPHDEVKLVSTRQKGHQPYVDVSRECGQIGEVSCHPFQIRHGQIDAVDGIELARLSPQHSAHLRHPLFGFTQGGETHYDLTNDGVLALSLGLFLGQLQLTFPVVRLSLSHILITPAIDKPEDGGHYSSSNGDEDSSPRSLRIQTERVVPTGDPNVLIADLHVRSPSAALVMEVAA